MGSQFLGKVIKTSTRPLGRFSLVFLRANIYFFNLASIDSGMKGLRWSFQILQMKVYCPTWIANIKGMFGFGKNVGLGFFIDLPSIQSRRDTTPHSQLCHFRTCSNLNFYIIRLWLFLLLLFLLLLFFISSMVMETAPNCSLIRKIWDLSKFRVQTLELRLVLVTYSKHCVVHM